MFMKRARPGESVALRRPIRLGVAGFLLPKDRVALKESVYSAPNYYRQSMTVLLRALFVSFAAGMNR